jgi:hypothetical protein
MSLLLIIQEMILNGNAVVKQVRNNGQLLLTIAGKDVFVPQFLIEQELRKQFIEPTASVMQAAINNIVSCEAEERAAGSTYLVDGVTKARKVDSLQATSIVITDLAFENLNVGRMMFDLEVAKAKATINAVNQPAFKALNASTTPVTTKPEEELAEEETLQPVVDEVATPKTGK